MCKERGYTRCGQQLIRVHDVDAQLVEILNTLQIPADYQMQGKEAVRNRAEHAAAYERMKTVEATIERINFCAA